MPRLFLLLISMLLLVGMRVDVAPSAHGARAELTAPADDDCHCCPDGDQEKGDEGAGDEGATDCCDWDFGACCATGTAAALCSARVRVARHVLPLPETRTAVPVHLRPRDNGPPPTPPPIG